MQLLKKTPKPLTAKEAQKMIQEELFEFSKAMRSMVKEELRSSLEDPIKTINRMYEDRELFLKYEVTLKNIESQITQSVDRLRNLDKHVKEEMADVHDSVKVVHDNVTEVTKAITE